MLALRRASGLRFAPLGARSLRPLATESYTERMDKTGRPVSPHVTIYKFPAAALSSITTRITGVMLTVGTSAIGAASLAGADVPALVSSCQLAAPALVPVAKVAITYPLTYHWLSAMRHAVRRAARRGSGAWRPIAQHRARARLSVLTCAQCPLISRRVCSSAMPSPPRACARAVLGLDGLGPAHQDGAHHLARALRGCWPSLARLRGHLERHRDEVGTAGAWRAGGGCRPSLRREWRSVTRD